MGASGKTDTHGHYCKYSQPHPCRFEPNPFFFTNKYLKPSCQSELTNMFQRKTFSITSNFIKSSRVQSKENYLILYSDEIVVNKKNYDDEMIIEIFCFIQLIIMHFSATVVISQFSLSIILQSP